MPRITLRRALVALAVCATLARAQDAYSFAIGHGVDVQAATDAEGAPQLTFSTEAGVPYTHPYDAQKIGADGACDAVPRAAVALT